jgi:hypothetical protein
MPVKLKRHKIIFYVKLFTGHKKINLEFQLRRKMSICKVFCLAAPATKHVAWKCYSAMYRDGRNTNSSKDDYSAA